MKKNISVEIDGAGFQKPISVIVCGVENIKNVVIDGVEKVDESIMKQLKHSGIYSYPPYANFGENGVEGVKLTTYLMKNSKENCEFSFFNEKGELQKNAEEVQVVDDGDDNITRTTVGYLFISKLRYDESAMKSDENSAIGVIFSIKITYINEGGAEVTTMGYFVVYLPTNTMGRHLSLPLYYRPFYFNSVLLLIPASFKKDGVSFTNDTNLSEFFKDGTKVTDNYDEDSTYVKKAATVEINDGNTTYTIENGFTASLKIETAGKKVIIGNGSKIRYNDKVYKYNGKNKEIVCTQHASGYSGSLTLGFSENTEVIFTCTIDKSIKNYTIEIKIKLGLPKTACYGRLFYSIANGCSIRDAYDKDKNIYKLNDVTLSYINGDNIGNVEVKHPFRCYSELESSPFGYANVLTDAGEKVSVTKKMMYGITEPFRKRRIPGVDGNNDYVKKEDVTTGLMRDGGTNETRNFTKESYDYNQTRYFDEWKTTITFDEGKVVPDEEGRDIVTDVENVNIWFKADSKVQNHFYSGLMRYDYWTNIYYKIEGQDTDYKLLRQDFIDKRRKKGSFEHNYGFHLFKNEKGKYVIEECSTVGNCEHLVGKKMKLINLACEYYKKANVGCKGSVTIRMTYKRTYYDTNVEVFRDGLPCCGNIEISSYGYAHGGKGVNDIYDGDIVQILNNSNVVINDELNFIIFDSHEWSDFSFKVEEGHPDGEENYESAIVGFNDVKFYDDIKLKDGTITVDGVTNERTRYFALQGTNSDNFENELYTFIKNLCGIGYTEGDGIVRYKGVNICDYIDINDGKHVKTKDSGWKGIHTYFKSVNGDTDVWLSGKEKGSSGGHECIDITSELKQTRIEGGKKQHVKWDCGNGTPERRFVIGVHDSYTVLDNDEYEKENNEMYSVVKKHTNRFAIFRLYKVNE